MNNTSPDLPKKKHMRQKILMAALFSAFTFFVTCVLPMDNSSIYIMQYFMPLEINIHCSKDAMICYANKMTLMS